MAVGADSMSGGAGDDPYIVDDAGDKIADSGGLDAVVSTIDYVLAATLENLQLFGTGALLKRDRQCGGERDRRQQRRESAVGPGRHDSSAATTTTTPCSAASATIRSTDTSTTTC